VPAASIYLHTRDPESEKKRQDIMVESWHLRAGAWIYRGGATGEQIAIREGEKERKGEWYGVVVHVEQVAARRDRWSRNPVGRALMRRGGSRYVREDATSSVRLPGQAKPKGNARASATARGGRRILHREHTATIAAAATAAPR